MNAEKNKRGAIDEILLEGKTELRCPYNDSMVRTSIPFKFSHDLVRHIENFKVLFISLLTMILARII